jgi:TolB-like protein/Tfp pilus assembly protein PilF
MPLFKELKRRNVIRVAMAYLVAAWLIIQVAETILPAYGMGGAAIRLVVTILAVAFIPVLAFSWAFEITTEGLKREVDVVRESSISRFSAKRLDRMIMLLLALALGYFAFDKFVLDPVEDVQIAESARHEGRSEALTESYGDKSIAVLPFVNMSDDEANEYFSDGISEELLNLLAKIPELRVISRSSAFSFKGKDVAIPAIAKQLNVAHVLEGSVRKAGKQVRITAQLIDTGSDSHLWSESYDRELTAGNVFAIQAQIAGSISAALNTVLAKEDRTRLGQAPTQNLEAYEAYLLGKQRLSTRTRAELLEASGYFEKASSLDPKYVLAYVGLADANLLLGNYGYIALSRALAVVEPALSTALSLDDQLGAVHTSMGLSRTLKGDSFGAEAAYKRAIALDPNNAQSYHWYGDLLLNGFGQPEAALPLLQKARELDPLSPVINATIGEAFSNVGNFREAMAFYFKAVEIEPEFSAAYNVIGMAFLALNDVAEAEYWINRGVSVAPGEILTNQSRVVLFRYRGEEERALHAARQLHASAPGNNSSLVTLVSFGRYQEALDTIAPAYPELSCEVEPIVGRNTLYQAVNLSLALQETGERACADRILDKMLIRMQELPRKGYRTYGFLDAEIYARQGKTQQALAALREAIDEGQRVTWWSQVERSPHMSSLRENSEFKAMVAEVRADMAAQLADVRGLEAIGKLKQIPE